MKWIFLIFKNLFSNEKLGHTECSIPNKIIDIARNWNPNQQLLDIEENDIL